MSISYNMSDFGTMIAPATLKITRQLPIKADALWPYLVDSNLRAKWLASGAMEPLVGSSAVLQWDNNKLTDPAGTPPEGMTGTSTLETQIVAYVPNKRLTFLWHNGGEVTFDLTDNDEGVLLSVTHERVTARGMQLGVSAGWHTHLSILADVISGQKPAPLWNQWRALRSKYDEAMAEEAAAS